MPGFGPEVAWIKITILTIEAPTVSAWADNDLQNTETEDSANTELSLYRQM